MKPIIGINANLVNEDRYKCARVHIDYCRAVSRAKGIPVILPAMLDINQIKSVLKKIDGLILSGGDDDINPRIYGEKSIPQTKIIHPGKQLFDITLTRLAIKGNIPILAICYGIQLLNIACGGTLVQNIRTQLKKVLPHKRRHHQVYLAEGSRLREIIGAGKITTNSAHHQALKEAGKRLTINARSEDSLIEGVEMNNKHHFVVGVQWHPERLIHQKPHLNLFRALIKEARKS